jgi:type IV fimbrial biogenesis protein FimT
MDHPARAIRRISTTAFSCRQPCRGFTLTELLVTLAIASILMVVALPVMNSVGTAMRLTSLSNDFLSQLHLARSEAIKRNSRVAICKSGDGSSCSESGDWEQGSIVFHDANDNGLREVDEQLIQRGQPLPDDFRFTGNQNVRHYISFDPRGVTHQAGALTLCSRSTEPVTARQVVISMVGRPRIKKTSLESCA